MGTIIDFMFNGIINEALINDGTKFIHLFLATFITKFNSYTSTRLCQNSIHCYLFFVIKLVVWFVMIPMTVLLIMS
jgi:hypothetical protein